ncbi:hypothetical protein V2J09_021360 [Rumex salicifolius]
MYVTTYPGEIRTPQILINKTKKAGTHKMNFVILHLLVVVVFVHLFSEAEGYRHQMSDDYHVRKLEAFKASLAGRHIYNSQPAGLHRAREYHVTMSYGADPTGRTDSTEALLRVFADASKAPADEKLIPGIRNVGGATINLDGGIYRISRPLRSPTSGVGNIVIHGGTLKASEAFPIGGYLIELSTSSPLPSSQPDKILHNATAASSYNYEYITFRDLLLDSSFRGGGLAVDNLIMYLGSPYNCLRTSVDNLYVTHFATDGILVRSGHETLIRHTFLGQHITAGGDPGERSFTGTGVTLLGNDNIVSDVVVFSAATGVLVGGQANLISGLHCYNKATGFGGVGVYLRLPGLTQTRIIGSYMDYTGIVAEDPVQLLVSGNFFLGDATVTLKAVKGVVNGVSVVDNMFSGSGSGVEIVKLDGSFREVEDVVVGRNIVKGMRLKATSAKAHVQGSGGSTWTADFNGVLLFPDMIRNVQYSALTAGNVSNSLSFRKVTFEMRNVSDNRVVIQSDVAVGNGTSVYVMVDQED